MASDKEEKPKPGRGASLRSVARGRKPRLKAAERIRDVDDLSKPGYHNDGNGLYMSVSAKGGKAWVFRYRWEGRLREMGLGSYPSVSLEDARGERDRWRRIYQVDGLDPIEERRRMETAAKASIENANREVQDEAARKERARFGACAESFIGGQEAGWKNEKHRQQWRNTLATYCTPIWAKDAAEITNLDVKAILDPIWLTKHETASRLRGRIERVLAFAKVSGLRVGENPARWKENLDHMMPAYKKRLVRGHHKAKPHEKVRDLVAELREISTVTARGLEFTVLAIKRTTEVRAAQWSEFDMEARVWTIPGIRMKTSRDHREPLTNRQIEILAEMAQMKTAADLAAPGGGYVFKGRNPVRPLSSGTMYVLLRRRGHDDATVHGFRSSFRDWTADKTTFPRDLAEMSLSHKVADDTEEAYWRSDGLEKRRKLMEAWSNYVEPTAAGPKVIAFRQA